MISSRHTKPHKPRRPKDIAAPCIATVNFHAVASRLDRLADAELQHGHHGIAERLSRHAAELRAVAP